MSVRYLPVDLSRVFVTADGNTYVEATFADLRRPRISLREQRSRAGRFVRRDRPQLKEAPWPQHAHSVPEPATKINA